MKSLRSVLRHPSFSAVAVLIIALGVGLTTAVFSFFHAVLLDPFPYSDPEQLVRVVSVNAKTRVERGGSLLDVEDWRRSAKLLITAGAHTTFDTYLRTDDGRAEPVRMSQLDPEALQVLGVRPMLGRLLSPEENQPGGDVNKAVISARLWRTQFGSDSGIAGRTLRTAQASLTIVGVMPDGFGYPDRVEVWTPMETYYAASGAPKLRKSRFYGVTARLAPGVSLAQAEQELNSICEDLEKRYPSDNEAVRARLIPLRDVEAGPIRPYLELLMAAAVLVWAACGINVAGMTFAREASRRQELGVRLALGASPGAVLRPLLAESAWLAGAGGAAGILLAFIALRALLMSIPVPLPAWMNIRISPAALVFALCVTTALALACPAASAWHALRAGLNEILRQGGRTAATGSRFRHALVVVQVALSLTLVVCAGLMLRSFLSLNSVATGFDPDNLLVARVSTFLPGKRAERAAILSARHDRILQAIRVLPGVLAAGTTNGLPYAGIYQNAASIRGNSEIRVKGRSAEEVRQLPMVAASDVSTGFLETMRIPLLRGRTFDRRDTPDSPLVVMVSQRAAETLWPGRDPIGDEVSVGPPTSDNPPCRVIGITANVRHEPGEPSGGVEFYYPYTQYPATQVFFTVRTKSSPHLLASPVRQAILSAQKDAAIISIKPMRTLMDEALWQRRLWGMLFAVFASLALLLSAVGLYGLISYSVNQQRREFGIRAALGASRSGLIQMVLGTGVRLAGAGAVLGLAGAVAAAPLLRTLLHGVTAFDPVSYAVALVILAAVVIVATLVPAVRASTVDPAEALRDT
jgi:putative ABC transport system permease protein